MAGRSHVIARTFDRVCAVLDHLGYLDGGTGHPGRQAARGLYTELDLLAAECLRRGLWDGLDPAELAACVSALIFEARQARRGRRAAASRRPGPRRRGRHGLGLGRAGRRRGGAPAGLPREPDLGFAWAAHAWARGKPLESVLRPDLTPGDFVRAVKQLMDLLGQIAVAAGRDTALGVHRTYRWPKPSGAGSSRTPRWAYDAGRRSRAVRSGMTDLKASPAWWPAIMVCA